MSPDPNQERTPEERERARRERESRRAARVAREEAGRGSKRHELLRGARERFRRSAEPAAGSDRGERPSPPRPNPVTSRIEAARRAVVARRGAIRSPTEAGPDAAPPARAALPDEAPRPALPRLEPRQGAPPQGADDRHGWIALALTGAAVAVVILFAALLFQPFKGEGAGKVRVNIPRGAGVGEIADVLAGRGVVTNALLFEIRATLAGRRSELRPGSYELRRDMSYGAALDLLAKGPPAPELVSVTIPEGQSRAEIASAVEAAGLAGDYEEATERSKSLDPRDYGGKGAADLEGFLFPATYEVRTGDSVEALVRKQLATFEEHLEGVDLRAAKKVNLTPFDVLTIASMVEREAQLDKERPLVASVIYNRLRERIPLGIDATIRFATDNWTKPISPADLQLDSPYNTRTNQGLPPGPIGNPGLAAIEAAAHPEKTDYLYFVVKPGACGEHVFSKTDAQFQRDVERYNAERAARGGESPTDCPE